MIDLINQVDVDLEVQKLHPFNNKRPGFVPEEADHFSPIGLGVELEAEENGVLLFLPHVFFDESGVVLQHLEVLDVVA